MHENYQIYQAWRAANVRYFRCDVGIHYESADLFDERDNKEAPYRITFAARIISIRREMHSHEENSYLSVSLSFPDHPGPA